jgi:transketolase
MIYNPDVQLSTQKAFAENLVKLGSKYKNVVVLDSNMSAVIGTQKFAKVFPDRHFNFGNAVENMYGAATGFTVRGKLPFVCAYALAATAQSSDQIRNYICYPNLNVKIVGANAGLLNGQEGATNQALEDIAMMRSLPNMKVVCPADAVETRKALEVMMLDYGPTYLRLFHLPLPELYDDAYKFVFGKGHIYKYGSDVCLLALGTAVHTSLEAAKILERAGISAMVVNMASIKPIDEDLIIECAKQVQHLFTVEDHNIIGGLGSAVSEVLCSRHPCKLVRLGMEGFGESGKIDDLYRKYHLDGQGIADQVMESIK